MSKANVLHLNNRCELWIDGVNVAAPVAFCSAKELPEVMDRVAADEVVVDFRTTDKAADVAADVRKYGRRLDGLVERWDRSEWAPKSVNGNVLSCVYACTLRRRQSHEQA